MLISYYGEEVAIEFPSEEGNSLPVGLVMLTQVGIELATICQGDPCARYMEHCLEKWVSEGIRPSCRFPLEHAGRSDGDL